MIRRIKLAYQLYNFFHKDELDHNTALYKQYGLKKKYYSSVSSKDFIGISEERKSSIKTLTNIPFYKTLDDRSKQSVDRFDEDGYCVIRNYWSQEQVSQVNAEIDRLLDNKEIDFKYKNKLMFSIHKSDYLKKACYDKQLKELLDYFIGGDAYLFQSINFLSGSEQKTHSDSIHMTTFPLGGLLGVWIALEDINEENGAIHYYPKSHMLPYYLNSDYANDGNTLLIGDKPYTVYEDMIEQKLREQQLEKKIFRAKRGDMLIWHANLLHGGEPHINKEKTRKSMVLHFFDRTRICYHEISQRPALFKK